MIFTKESALRFWREGIFRTSKLISMAVTLKNSIIFQITYVQTCICIVINIGLLCLFRLFFMHALYIVLICCFIMFKRFLGFIYRNKLSHLKTDENLNWKLKNYDFIDFSFNTVERYAKSIQNCRKSKQNRNTDLPLQRWKLELLRVFKGENTLRVNPTENGQ